MPIIIICTITGCDVTTQQSQLDEAAMPELPDDIEYSENGIPMINVYIKSEDRIENMDIESYLCGVLAGEMRNDWPIEALKAQAILARTYTLKFLDTKESKYDGADISTDVTEAQAYNSESINSRIKQAVDETRGMLWFIITSCLTPGSTHIQAV